MPQLMPLAWVVSPCMLMLMLLCAVLIYSNSEMNISSLVSEEVEHIKFMWFW